ncbi:BlaI/MecI/CopY family transcriptional regulator [Ignavigranum ruoffiae]|uniref:BlaI/MecI/CopY family transcriptional regulator n=1 Tax=Ignavigranum ruoffiae TaxID=89093 RepID=UPI0024AD7DAA|nr:BlaI/MecI/CopY family transcriptional regulator [Ignavigranum ruoffiae]
MNLTNKELEIMKIFWESDKALSAKELCVENNLILSTTQVCLKNLLENKFIKIDHITTNTKALTRKFVPCISKEEYIIKEYESINMNELILAFLKNNHIKKEERQEIIDIINTQKS